MLQAFGPEIWLAEGPVVTAAAGFHYPTRMAILRLKERSLMLWSPVALTPELRAAVEALGQPRYLIAPNSLHDSFLAEWHHAFPEAQVFAPPGLAEKRPDIVFAGTLTVQAGSGWEDEVDMVIVGGNRITTEVVLFHKASRTALFADLLQQFPPGWFRGWRGIVARLDLMVSPELAVPRKFRLAFTDRALARQALSHILRWPAERVVVAHGQPVRQGGQALLRRAFGWLIKA